MTATDVARNYSDVLNRAAAGALVIDSRDPRDRIRRRRDLGRSARVIGAHDLLIAATALAHGVGIATHNAGEFRRVPGLRVVASA